MKNLNDLPGLQELCAQEKIAINGGGSFWYAPADIFARMLKFAYGAFENPPHIPVEYK